ncbi:hypothetical protein ACFVG9_26995 [Saccharothrix carnea]|nr:hypothetical protein A6A25_31035 [Saccharothrix sp. CB00851]
MGVWCRQDLIKVLVDGCEVEQEQADAVADDVLARATAFSSLSDRTRDVLMTPFVEEVFDYEPRDASMEIIAATTVVVRNSSLEDLHASGPVGDSALRVITTRAAGPLSHLIAAGRRSPVQPTGHDPFTGLDARYPRAWACLEALAGIVTGDGGRADYRCPTTNRPPLPGQEEEVDVRLSQQIDGAVLLSGTDPRFDQNIMALLRRAVEQPTIVFVPSLSRFSRDTAKQLRVLEILLAHGSTVLTTNHMLRGTDVWSRSGPRVKPDANEALDRLGQMEGLRGAHRRTVQQYLRLMADSA